MGSATRLLPVVLIKYERVGLESNIIFSTGSTTMLRSVALLLAIPATAGAASVHVAALSAPVECKWSHKGHT